MLSAGLINVNWPLWRVSKLVWKRNSLGWNSLQWPVYFINSVDNTKLPYLFYIFHLHRGFNYFSISRCGWYNSQLCHKVESKHKSLLAGQTDVSERSYRQHYGTSDLLLLKLLLQNHSYFRSLNNSQLRVENRILVFVWQTKFCFSLNRLIVF